MSVIHTFIACFNTLESSGCNSTVCRLLSWMENAFAGAIADPSVVADSAYRPACVVLSTAVLL